MQYFIRHSLQQLNRRAGIREHLPEQSIMAMTARFDAAFLGMGTLELIEA